jgi:hypothetical protein
MPEVNIKTVKAKRQSERDRLNRMTRREQAEYCKTVRAGLPEKDSQTGHQNSTAIKGQAHFKK